MDEVIAGNAVSVTVNVRNTANRKSHVSFLIGGSSAAPSVPSDASVVAFEEDDIVEAHMSRAFDLSSSTLNSKSFSDNALFDSFFFFFFFSSSFHLSFQSQSLHSLLLSSLKSLALSRPLFLLFSFSRRK